MALKLAQSVRCSCVCWKVGLFVVSPCVAKETGCSTFNGLEALQVVRSFLFFRRSIEPRDNQFAGSVWQGLNQRKRRNVCCGGGVFLFLSSKQLQCKVPFVWKSGRAEGSQEAPVKQMGNRIQPVLSGGFHIGDL